jgi:hypothetical protein
MTKPSWRLKLDRAEHHLEELRGLVDSYKAGHAPENLQTR